MTMITQADLEKQAFLIELISSLRNRDNWCGETHVQKTVYFVQLLSGETSPFKFILYKHGPFSFELSEALSVMGAFKYLEDEIPKPDYGPRLKPNSDAKEMLSKQFGTLAHTLKPQIDFVTAKLSQCGVAMLERLATALYFTKQQPIEDQVARAKKINEVKPHISETEALKAVRTVEAILLEWNQYTAKSN